MLFLVLLVTLLLTLMLIVFIGASIEQLLVVDVRIASTAHGYTSGFT